MHITKPETSSSNSLHEQEDFAYLIMLIQDMLSGFIAISAIPLIYPVEPTPEPTKQACHRPIAHFSPCVPIACWKSIYQVANHS